MKLQPGLFHFSLCVIKCTAQVHMATQVSLLEMFYDTYSKGTLGRLYNNFQRTVIYYKSGARWLPSCLTF